MTAEQFDVIFNGKKYDIKKFLRDHPGGLNTLKHYKGRSIVDAMAKFSHSSSAYHMLNDFKTEDSNLTGEVSATGRIITKEDTGKNFEDIAFLEELESRLDWSQPILAQLDKIAPHYDAWVNSAVYRNCRLFKSPALEALTFTPWYIVPAFWIPVILYLGCTQFLRYVLCSDSCGRDSLSCLQFGYHVAFGVLIWTILEYSLHRWVFHLNPGSSSAMIKIHFLIHGLHHKVPFDDYRQVFPPIPAAVLAYSIFSIITVVFSYPLIKMTGGLIGYLTYDLIHCYVHRGSPAAGSYLYSMKRYHSNHHFINHDKAFGISSKLWDLVFKTFVQVRKLNFNLQW